MTDKNIGLNLSKIKYDQDGNIIIDDEDDVIEQTTIDDTTTDELTDIDKDTTDIPTDQLLGQTYSQIEADLKAQKKREKERLKEVGVYMNKRNTMFLSCLIFTLIGLGLGTFVFQDYLITTAIGLIAGILVGRHLCKDIVTERIEETFVELPQDEDK